MNKLEENKLLYIKSMASEYISLLKEIDSDIHFTPFSLSKDEKIIVNPILQDASDFINKCTNDLTPKFTSELANEIFEEIRDDKALMDLATDFSNQSVFPKELAKELTQLISNELAKVRIEKSIVDENKKLIEQYKKSTPNIEF